MLTIDSIATTRDYEIAMNVDKAGTPVLIAVINEVEHRLVGTEGGFDAEALAPLVRTAIAMSDRTIKSLTFDVWKS